jgi:hypothetical protein
MARIKEVFRARLRRHQEIGATWHNESSPVDARGREAGSRFEVT